MSVPLSYYMSVRLERGQCTCNQDQDEQAEDSVELGEDGEHHRSTEGIVTSPNSRDTIGTYLSLANSGEEGDEAASKACTEDSS